jgi:hypothetical protein
MTPEEQGTYEAKDRTKESTVTSLIQTNFSTALRLFSINYQNICTPVSVLADSGADLGLCISSRIAKRFGLTWTPGNAPLTGVGGLRILESISNEDVVLRLGGDGREDYIETTPKGGCFTVRIQPNIMSEDTVAALGYECLMGQIAPVAFPCELQPIQRNHGDCACPRLKWVFSVSHLHPMQDDHR